MGEERNASAASEAHLEKILSTPVGFKALNAVPNQPLTPSEFDSKKTGDLGSKCLDEERKTGASSIGQDIGEEKNPFVGEESGNGQGVVVKKVREDAEEAESNDTPAGNMKTASDAPSKPEVNTPEMTPSLVVASDPGSVAPDQEKTLNVHAGESAV